MADGIEIQISGLTEIQEQLRQLPGTISRRVVLSSLRAGANVVRKQIQQTAPVRTGALKKGFKIARSRIHRTQTDQGVYLTLRKGRGRNDPKDAFYGRWVESGYRKGRTQIPGQFIVQKAFDAKKNESVAVIVATAEAKIDQLTRNIGH